MNPARIDVRPYFLSPVALFLLMLSLAMSSGAPASEGKERSASISPPIPCNYYYEWIGKVRFPLQADPHATYTYVAASSGAARDGIGFLVRGEFIHGVFTSWLTYGKGAKAFSGVNTNDVIAADPGSLNPFVSGQPMLGTPRNFTLLFTPDGYPEGDLAPSLDGTTTADIATSNRQPYPLVKKNGFWVLANRDYQAFPGYNPGGTMKDTFPVVTAVNLRTGEPLNCQDYNLIPKKLQRSPADPPDALNYGRVPIRIALQNGAHFDFLGDFGGGSHSQFGPKNPPGLVQFTRPPLGPGADVPTVPPPDNCSGYIATRTSTRLVTLVRIPHIANYTETRGLTSSSTYPNPVAKPWQAAYLSFSMYGSSSGFYLPGNPKTTSIADWEFQVDATGGSTVLIWPRNLPRRQQRRVFAYAEAQGWPIVRGGTSGRETTANVLIRVKASAPDYFGRDSNLPCFFDEPKNQHKAWSDVPVHVGSPWVATAQNLGAAAPQGVTCSSIGELTDGRCLDKLMKHIEATGGSYFASPPPSR